MESQNHRKLEKVNQGIRLITYWPESGTRPSNNMHRRIFHERRAATGLMLPKNRKTAQTRAIWSHQRQSFTPNPTAPYQNRLDQRVDGGAQLRQRYPG